jgi:hypothetical protein
MTSPVEPPTCTPRGVCVAKRVRWALPLRRARRARCERCAMGACGRGSAHLLAEGVKVLEVGLVQRVADDLNVHLVEVVEREAVAKVRAERCVDEHGAVPVAHDGCGRGVMQARSRCAVGRWRPGGSAA